MPLPMQLWHLGAGHIISAATQVAAKLAIADLLVAGPVSVEHLAQLTHSDSRSLLRVLRALASVGVFHEQPSGVFAQSELSEFLRSDVAGSQRSLCIANAQPDNWLQGVLFDTPDVISTARSAPAKKVLRDRAEFVKGNFFVAVPTGCDTYLMKFILHDWDDDHATTILRNIRTAMTADSTLLVVGAVIPPGNEPSMNKILDLQMLVALSGHERTEEEFAQLMCAAGLRLDRVMPTPSPLSILHVSAAQLP